MGENHAGMEPPPVPRNPRGARVRLRPAAANADAARQA